MMGADSGRSPLETSSETLDERAIEAFEILSNETRLSILLALWEAMEPVTFQEGSNALSFAELRNRVGMRDSGQFNYHLNRLVGPFLRQNEEGYTLTPTAEQVLRAVLAETLTEPDALKGEPIDIECDYCGGSTVIDYDDGILVLRCTSCEGGYGGPDHRPGTLARSHRPPVGLLDRTPQEFFQHGNAWDRHRFESAADGVCQDCSGHVSTTIRACGDHDATEGSVCDTCGWVAEVHSLMKCEVCKATWRTPGKDLIWMELPVKAFFYERGVDVDESWDTWSNRHVFRKSIKEVSITEDEPLELTITIEFDGDRLRVTLDDEGQVRRVSEEE
jgi:hypothetical protein